MIGSVLWAASSLITHAPIVIPEAIAIFAFAISCQSKERRISQCSVGYAKFYSRSHHAVIRVYNEAGNVIETHEHAGEFKEW
jgi:hypothetical protein